MFGGRSRRVCVWGGGDEWEEMFSRNIGRKMVEEMVGVV